MAARFGFDLGGSGGGVAAAQLGILDGTAQSEVHVGGLPAGTKAADVVEVLQNQAGFAHQVLECTVKTNPRRGATFAFACVESADVMRRLIDASNHGLGIRIGGRKLTVNPSNKARNVRLTPAEQLSVVNVTSFSIGVHLEGRRQYLSRWNSAANGIAPDSIKCTVNFDEQRMSVSFGVQGDRQYLLEYSMLDLDGFVVSEHGSHCTACTKAKVAGRTTVDGHLSDSCRLVLRFALAPQVLTNRSRSSGADAVLGDDDLHYQLDLRRSQRWQRTLGTFTSDVDTLGQYFHLLLESGRETRHLLRFAADLRQNYGDYESEENVISVQGMPVSIKRWQYDELCRAHSQRFRELFQLEVLVSHGLVYREMLGADFFDLLHHEHAWHALRYHSDQYIVLESPLDDLRKAIALVRADPQLRSSTEAGTALNDGGNQIWIYRLNLTPLTAYALGPELDMPNRVLRHYSHPALKQRFLRVHIVEENQMRLHVGSAKYPLQEVLDDVQKKLTGGIMFCGRRYEFLAMSNSQLRDHACWFFAPTREVNAAVIRAWMGNFEKLTNVAKYAARMGQCFSSTSTAHSLSIQRDEYGMIEDIMGGPEDRYNFSDGIGMISAEFAEEAVRSLSIKKGPRPSAFQIRFAGYKGVVAVNPVTMPPRFKLLLRPSMRKFYSEHLQLEVIQVARRFPGHLNREIILLLSTLGVRDQVFQRLQEDMVENLDRVVKSRQAALTEIGSNCCLDETYAITTVMHAMLNSGFEPTAEPFLQSMLLGYRQNCLLKLEEKAHILIDRGALLMGVLDESRTLARGQVVVQNWVQGRAVPFVGKVVIAKNPCLHPGDIHVLDAVAPPVDNAYLQGLVDCLVFPARGERPHPDECSGSDLDGDQYFVSWDERLIPPRTHPPADYDAVAPQFKHPIVIDDVCAFFVDYMKNDVLGPICIAHQAFADGSDLSAQDPICLELAEMQSQAVDYPKTGIAVERDPLRHNPPAYPDFLKKSKKKMYESKKVLGKLYRHIAKQRPSWAAERPDSLPKLERSLLLDGRVEYMRAARQLRSEYNHQLLAIMKRYGVWKEEEAVGGYMVKVTSRHRRRQRLHDVQAQVRLETLRLRVHFYDTEFKDLPEGERLAKASAWYDVTYSAPADVVRQTLGRRRTRDRYRRLLSFAWIAYAELCRIRTAAERMVLRSGCRLPVTPARR